MDRFMTWVAKCSGRRSSSSKDPKTGRQEPIEKHQAIKFEYAKSREEIGRVFWGQAVEKPQCQAEEFVLDSVVSRESLEAVE